MIYTNLALVRTSAEKAESFSSVASKADTFLPCAQIFNTDVLLGFARGNCENQQDRLDHLLVKVRVSCQFLHLLEAESLGDEKLAEGSLFIAKGGSSFVVREETLKFNHALERSCRGMYTIGALINVSQSKLGFLLWVVTYM